MAPVRQARRPREGRAADPHDDRAATRQGWLRMLGVAVVVAVLGGGAWVAWQQVEPPVLVAVERCSATAEGVEHSLAPDQAANAAMIAAVARARGLPARAVTIALATAVQESRLRNISYGDRDSLGLFQQRPSQGWGTAEEILDPVRSTGVFYDALVRVDGYEALPITDAAQRVQRSGFPLAYAAHEPQARAYASALTGYSPATLVCRLRPAGDSSRQQPGADGLWPRAAVVRDRAAVELGATPVAVGPAGEDGGDGTGTDGRVLVLGAPAGGEEGLRQGWALAHWAVAHAADLGITEVAVDGLVWRRARPDDGWRPVAEAGGVLAAPEAGTAAVRVAG